MDSDDGFGVRRLDAKERVQHVHVQDADDGVILTPLLELGGTGEEAAELGGLALTDIGIFQRNAVLGHLDAPVGEVVEVAQRVGAGKLPEGLESFFVGAVRVEKCLPEIWVPVDIGNYGMVDKTTCIFVSNDSNYVFDRPVC